MGQESKFPGVAVSEDQYGNLLNADGEPLSDVGVYTDGINEHCVFPDCGCPGARLCDAKRGAHWGAVQLNIEHGQLEAQAKRNKERERSERIARCSGGHISVGCHSSEAFMRGPPFLIEYHHCANCGAAWNVTDGKKGKEYRDA